MVKIADDPRAGAREGRAARQIADGAVVAVVVEVGAHPYRGVFESIAIVECQRRCIAARLMGTDVDSTSKVGPVAMKVGTDVGGVEVERTGTRQCATIVTAAVEIPGGCSTLRHLNIGIVVGIGPHTVGVAQRTTVEDDLTGVCMHAVAVLATSHLTRIDNERAITCRGRELQRSSARLSQCVARTSNSTLQYQRHTTRRINGTTISTERDWMSARHGRRGLKRTVVQGQAVGVEAQSSVVYTRRLSEVVDNECARIDCCGAAEGTDVIERHFASAVLLDDGVTGDAVSGEGVVLLIVVEHNLRGTHGLGQLHIGLGSTVLEIDAVA